jgi:hypothetical protein
MVRNAVAGPITCVVIAALGGFLAAFLAGGVEAVVRVLVTIVVALGKL